MGLGERTGDWMVAVTLSPSFLTHKVERNPHRMLRGLNKEEAWMKVLYLLWTLPRRYYCDFLPRVRWPDVNDVLGCDGGVSWMGFSLEWSAPSSPKMQLWNPNHRVAMAVLWCSPHSLIDSFLHSFSNYLAVNYMPNGTSGTGHTAVNSPQTPLPSWSLQSSVKVYAKCVQRSDRTGFTLWFHHVLTMSLWATLQLSLPQFLHL